MAEEYVDVRIRLRDARAFQAAMNSSAAAAHRLGTETERAGLKARGATSHFRGYSTVMGLVRSVTYATAFAMIGLGGATVKMGLDFNSTMESNTVAFRHFLGSTRAAKKELDILYDVAAKTPFEFPQLVSAARKFLAFGFTAKQTNKYLNTIGDTVAGMGGGADEINRAVIALGQMQAKGRVMGQELLQLNELGIPAQKILQKELHLTGDQIRQIGREGIKSSVAIPALMRGLDKQFGGSSAEQAKTMKGRLSTLHDYAAQALGTFTMPLYKALRDQIIPSLTLFTQQAKTAFEAFGFDGVVMVLDRMTRSHGRLSAAWEGLQSIVNDMVSVFRNSLLPALVILYNRFKFLLAPLVLARRLLAYLAGNGKKTRDIIVLLVTVMVAWRGIMLLNAAAGKALLAIEFARNLKSWIMQINVIKLVTTLWAGAQWLLNAAMSANPIVLVIAALVALGVAFYLAYTKIKWFHNAVNNVFNWIKAHWPLLVGIMLGPVAFIVIELIRHWDSFIGFFKKLPGRLADAGKGMFSWIPRLFKAALNAVIRAWNGLRFHIGIPKKVFGISIPGGGHGITINTPDIPRLAMGGNLMSAGSVMVGERGPELLSLPRGARVDPLPSARPAAISGTSVGGGAGASLSGLMRGGDVTVRVPLVLDGRVLAEVVARHTEDKAARR